MAFDTISFIALFLPVTLLFYYATVRYLKIQQLVLLAASLSFYWLGSEGWLSFSTLLFVIGWNWLGGHLIERQQRKKKKSILPVTLIVGVDILIFSLFRFTAIFQTNGWQPSVDWLIPLGLAWFILQGIGYCIEVYLGETAADKNILHFAIYVSFFPKLIHGPLIDFSKMKEQIGVGIFDIAQVGAGAQRFIIGLSKKLLIADQLAYFINYVFVQSAIDSVITQPPVTLVWLGLFVNGVQLYFILSAYADMAIGLAGMLGIRLPENFNHPFKATSLTDFWRRWQMTVISWFRKYFLRLINLELNRDQITINLLLTWLLIGLWFGFDWNHVFWGALNFVILIAEHFFSFSERVHSLLFRRVYTVLLVLIGFVFLRSESLYHTGQFLGDLFWLNNNGFYDARVAVFLRELWLPLLIGVYLMFVHPFLKEREYSAKWKKQAQWLRFGQMIGIILLYILCLLFILLDFGLGQTLI